MTLSDQQFDRTRRLALSLAGLELFDRHRELLGRRSRRLGISDDAGLDSLLGAAEMGESAATQKLVGLLTTKFTGFFRHPQHFQVATELSMRCIRRRGRARLWSAGAATGEEPFSLAIALIEALESDDPPVSILATDIDVGALAIARQGQYSAGALQSLEPSRRARFFREADAARRWTVAPAAQRLVEFRPLNLICDDWPGGELFDVIFCRNVLMYLQDGHRYTALARFASLLAPEGILVLDPTENLGRAAHLFASCADGVCVPRQEKTSRATRMEGCAANHGI